MESPNSLTPAAQSAEPQRVNSIEIALDALLSAHPRSGEKSYQFVGRCVRIVSGRKQQQQLRSAILSSLAELGVNGAESASNMQAVLRSLDAVTAEDVAAS